VRARAFRKKELRADQSNIWKSLTIMRKPKKTQSERLDLIAIENLRPSTHTKRIRPVKLF